MANGNNFLVTTDPNIWSGRGNRAYQRPFPTLQQGGNFAAYQQDVQNWFKERDAAMANPSFVSSARAASTGGRGGGASNITRKPYRRSPRGLPPLPAALQRQYQTSRANILATNALGRQQEQSQLAGSQRGVSGMLQGIGRQYAGGFADLLGGMAEAGVGTSPAISQMATNLMAGREATDRMAQAQRLAEAERAAQEAALQRIATTGQEMTDLEDWRMQQRAALTNQDLANLLKGAK